MSSEITFIVTDEAITVVDCRIVGARLGYTANGLLIYIDGSSKYHHPDCINNLAMQACEARHIPLITLRQQKQAYTPKPLDTETKRMF
jgi:hypothetical protein